jgi:excisionase family DNA binding protein
VQKEIEPVWISYEEARRLTSLGRTTIWRICRDENSGIRVARVGRAVRINRDSLEAYMRRNSHVTRRENTGEVENA